MTSEHCQVILDDVTIFLHLSAESTFLYSLHPDDSLYNNSPYVDVFNIVDQMQSLLIDLWKTELHFVDMLIGAFLPMLYCEEPEVHLMPAY